MNTKTFGETPPLWIATILWTCRVCLEMSCLSSGRSVQSMWKYTSIRSGRPGCAGARPQTFPWTLPRHTDHQSPLCVLCFSFFSPYKNSHIPGKWSGELLGRLGEAGTFWKVSRSSDSLPATHKILSNSAGFQTYGKFIIRNPGRTRARTRTAPPPPKKIEPEPESELEPEPKPFLRPRTRTRTRSRTRTLWFEVRLRVRQATQWKFYITVRMISMN